MAQMHDHANPHGATTARPLFHLWQLIRSDVRDLRMVVWFAIFVSLLSLVTPIAIQSLVETVQFGVVLWPILMLSAILFGCLMFAAVIRLCETYVVEYLLRKVFLRVLSQFAVRLPRVRLDALEGRYGPEIVNRFFDVLTVQKTGATLLLGGIEILLATTVGMMMLAFYHPILLAFDAVLIAALLVLFLLGGGAIRSSLAESHAKYDAAAWLQEVMRVPRILRSGMGPQLVLDRANEHAEHFLAARRRHFGIVFRQTIFAFLIHVIASTALLGIGGLLVVQGQLTWGQLVAAELIVALTVSNLSKIGKYLENYYDLLTAAEKLAQVTALPLERTDGEPLHAGPRGMSLRVRFEEIGAGRIESGEIEWEIQSNEKVAVVGPPGAGKSTVLEALAGFGEPSQGLVELDGIDLRDLNLDSVRQQVAIVEGVEIFQGTIEQNLRLGRTYLTSTDLREALAAVNLSAAIQALPGGMQTELTPTGSPLSGSQSLRLGIARAIVGHPRLLILDGVLDLIDLDEAPILFTQLFDRTRPCTLLVVTRNPEIIQRCDRVVEMSHPAPNRLSTQFDNPRE